MSEIIELNNISKSFGNKNVLVDFSLNVKQGEFVAISGPSGCGKSTLLNIIGLLDVMDSGEYKVFGESAPNPFSSRAERLLFDSVGYLFQNFALIENKSVAYNLEIAIHKHKRTDQKSKISNALKEVGLEGYEQKKVFQCSGGEQQRIALARLLLKNTKLVLCDEPTGSLDSENKNMVIDLLKSLNKNGSTIIVVTHDLDLVQASSREVKL